MLGVVAVVAMVLGGFAAGGGAFDWPFLFSDGHRDYAWVRSMGRDGARGLLLLFGSVLVLVGFVSQVVDSASQRVLVADAATSQTSVGLDTNDEVAVPNHFPSTNVPPAAGAPSANHATVKNATGSAVTPAQPVANPNDAKYDRPPDAASYGASDNSSAIAAPGPQPMTIWNPDAVAQGDDTLVELQYRFEPGHRPLPGSHYIWVIDVVGMTNEVQYDATILQQQGQLTHLIRLPLKRSGLEQAWSTVLVVETNGQRAQASNRLYVTPGQSVRSTPLAAPR